MRRKKLFTLQVLTWTQADLFFGFFLVLKPSLSMKILSINNFTIKLLSDLSIGVQLKRIFDTKKFSSKVDNRQYLIWKTVFLWKSCLIITLLPVFLVPFKWSLRRLLKCLVKSLIDNIFKEKKASVLSNGKKWSEKLLHQISVDVTNLSVIEWVEWDATNRDC